MLRTQSGTVPTTSDASVRRRHRGEDERGRRRQDEFFRVARSEATSTSKRSASAKRRAVLVASAGSGRALDRERGCGHRRLLSAIECFSRSTPPCERDEGAWPRERRDAHSQSRAIATARITVGAGLMRASPREGRAGDGTVRSRIDFQFFCAHYESRSLDLSFPGYGMRCRGLCSLRSARSAGGATMKCSKGAGSPRSSARITRPLRTVYCFEVVVKRQPPLV